MPVRGALPDLSLSSLWPSLAPWDVPFVAPPVIIWVVYLVRLPAILGSDHGLPMAVAVMSILSVFTFACLWLIRERTSLYEKLRPGSIIEEHEQRPSEGRDYLSNEEIRAAVAKARDAGLQ